MLGTHYHNIRMENNSTAQKTTDKAHKSNKTK